MRQWMQNVSLYVQERKKEEKRVGGVLEVRLLNVNCSRNSTFA